MKRPFCLLTFFILAFSNADFAAENFSLGNFGGENFTLEKMAKKSKEKNSKKDSSEVVPEEERPVTKINVDKSKKKNDAGYFSGIPDEILRDVEIGSPEALRSAYAKLKKPSVEYAENENVLLFCIEEIARVVWPSMDFSAGEPRISQRNAYVGAIESARNGIYDTSMSGSDFLSRALPSLVLCGNSGRSDYFERAKQDLLAALEINSKSVLANYLLGILFVNMKKEEEAVEHFKAAAGGTSAFEVDFRLASALNALSRYGESQTIIDRLIVAQPSNLRLLKLAAQNSFDRGNYASAERYAMLILTQNPADLEMVLFRAKVFVQTGEYLKSASLLDVYAKSNPNSKEYLVLRARIQKEWNRNSTAAIATMEKALALYPNDSEVVLYAASLAGETGKNIGGRSGAQLSSQILSDDPENPEALSFLIQNLADEEKWADAYAASKKLIEKNSSVQTISTHVKICLALGYLDEAWKSASSLYEKNPNDETAIQSYVDAMVRTGRTAQASRFINSMLDSAQSAMKSFLYYQRSFLVSGETAQLSDLRSAVIANPRNFDALFRMYEIYFQKKDYRKAQYYLRQVIALNPGNENFARLNSELDKLIK